MFTSKELQNCHAVPSSVTDNSIVNINIEQLKNDLRFLVMTKDKNLINTYDVVSMNRSNSSSFNETLKSILSIIRDFYCNKFREDTIKTLTIKKSFDIMIISLENLTLNTLDQNSNELNTILLSFLSRNFL
jgi:hypothetical protein